jgi:hypothetical protein
MRGPDVRLSNFGPIKFLFPSFFGKNFKEAAIFSPKLMSREEPLNKISGNASLFFL